MKRLIALALALALLASPAFAQNTFIAPGNQSVGSTVQMCLNAAGQAVACSAPVAGVSTPVLPAGAVSVTNSATGAAAAATATLPAAAGKFTYICGFSINSTATAAAAGNATITGTVSGTLNYEQGTGVSPAVVITQQTFTPCIPSSAVNTAEAVNTANPGAGGVISVSAWGYQF